MPDGVTNIRLPFARQSISLNLPEDPYALGDSLRAPGSNIYWAALWPSGLALADALLSGEIALSGPDVLETGCGIGLACVAAALSNPGLTVLASDIEPRALELTRINAELNGVAARISTQTIDWRKPPQQKFHSIVAADCLYESGADVPLAEFLRATLDPSPGSTAIVVDPERHTARNFHYVAREVGFQVRSWLRAVPFVLALGPLGGNEAAKIFAAPQRVTEHPPQVRFYELSF
jgi:predicted nicotinamide N-methyase